MDVKKISYSNINFKKGLTAAEINKVRNMDSLDVDRITHKMKQEYGIEAFCSGQKAVAFCLEQTAKIMSKAGFKLPKQFIFGPIEEKGVLGFYSPTHDTVVINACYKPFYDLKDLNSLEESNIGYHPITGHFLQTYIHEFSHAAHYKNLCDTLGKDKANDVFGNIMSGYSPNQVLVGPLNSFIKAEFPKFSKKIIDYIFPPANGLYSKTDITEYFAEKNSRNIATMLGDNFNISAIPDNYKNSYKEHPADWNIYKEVQAFATSMFRSTLLPRGVFKSSFESAMDNISKTVEFIQKEINYTDGDIWHGNVENIKKNLSLNKK